MAAPTTTDLYDEYVAGLVQGTYTQVDTWAVGLYDDSTDTIVATDDFAAITTEPSGNGYAAKSVTPSTGASLTIGADTTIDVDDQTWSSLTFTAATSVDAFYITADINLNADTAATTHLLAVGTLSGGPYDLQNYTDFTVQDIGITQTQS